MTGRSDKPSQPKTGDRSNLQTYGEDGQDQAHREFQPTQEAPPGNAEIASLPVNSAHLFEQALEQTRMAIAISDPHAPDTPLIFVNKAFEVLTGYDRRDVVGRNCRLLQTEDTDENALEELREAMRKRETIVVELENQRKDGSRFTNALHVGPIFDEDGELTHFYGSQWDLSDIENERAAVIGRDLVVKELRHRSGNLFGILASLVRMSGRNETDVGVAMEKASERIMALSRAHQATMPTPGAGADPADLRRLIDTVLNPYRSRAGNRILTGGPDVELPGHAVTPIGLAMHELATNAVKYGALVGADGRVTVEWTADDDVLRIVWCEEFGDGRQVDGSKAVKGTGTQLLEGILKNIDGDIAYDWRAEGPRITVTAPLTERV